MATDIPFLKMNGLGNEFVVLDARKHSFTLSKTALLAIADKKTGIGYDQLIVLENTPNADVFMRIYNADGSQVDACGNATRCIGALVMQELNSSKASVETNDGKKFAKWAGADHKKVTVNMGQAKLNWQNIPLSEEFHDTARIELEIGPLGNPILHTPSAMNIGNPHVTFWAKKHPDEYDLAGFGPMIENHPLFPERVNVSLGQVLPDNKIILRTWERGVGITRACGTGACAAAVSAHRRGFTDNKVTVNVPAGDIIIEWTNSNNVLMTGDWTFDYEGILPAEVFK